MALRTITAKGAMALDQELLSSGAFSIDQLMELAGLSVSQALYKLHPPSRGNRILVACGPGNNGGDGLVAARHLHQYGYRPSMYYPKRGKSELYQRLETQLRHLDVPFIGDFSAELDRSDYVVDAIFGFSFSGEVREPFLAVITALQNSAVPVLAVDVPSSWNIETGPPPTGPGSTFSPHALISLTAPKPLVKHFRGKHFIGGRFLSEKVAEKYGLDIPNYPGIDQVIDVSVEEQHL